MLACSARVRGQPEIADSWRRGAAIDWVGAGLGFAAALRLSLALDTNAPRWSGTGPMDAFFLRRAPRDPARWRRLSRASDVLASLVVGASLLDPALGAWREGDLGRELALVEVRSLALTTLVVTATKYGLARRRPRCTAEGRGRQGCASSDHRSFVSGHAAFAWTAATALCTVRRHVVLYGSRIADWTGCAASLALATATAALRVAARRHYLSDVVVGAVLGLVSGWLLPALATFGLGEP